jgi:catechol 2,3-dioxygenase-like lactoylglutathione lyase family enzyme
MIIGFDHVAITVADLDASCAFYTSVLDGRIDADYRVDGRSAVRRVFVGDALLSIHQSGNGVTPVARRPEPGSADLCFRWQGGIDSAVERLGIAQVAIAEGPVPRTAADGRRGQSVYFRDPDGNLLELLAT